MRFAWALAGVLALPGAATASPSSPSAVETGATEAPGRLVFGPASPSTVTVVDASGTTVATIARGRRVVVELPPGRYSLIDEQGQSLDEVEVVAGQALAALPDPPDGADPSVRVDSKDPANDPSAVVTRGRLGPPSIEAQQEVELIRRRRWARWAAPLLSAVVPGGGQAINGQPGRGLAAFTGTVGLVLGAVALAAARDPTAGATAAAGTGNGREIARLVGLAGLGQAAGLLYLGQVMDAHAQAVDRRPPRPRTRHVLALSVSRFTAVGFSPGQPAYDLYPDWSLAAMGQLVPRVSLGLADVGIQYARRRDTLTVQAGVRAAYRLFEGRRLWLSAGGGALLQGTRSQVPTTPTDDAGAMDGADSTSIDRVFSLSPYGHFDARLFLLDRWSLGLMPRVSVPLWPRRFRGGRTLPRYATTFELGANVEVYF